MSVSFSQVYFNLHLDSTASKFPLSSVGDFRGGEEAGSYA